MTDTVSTKSSYLTQEAYDRLKAELEHLSGPGRLDIARQIEEARQEGDLKENGGYHAAREEQGKMEDRIRRLTFLLENAIIGETPPDDGVVEPGMLVTTARICRCSPTAPRSAPRSSARRSATRPRTWLPTARRST